jgi:hypothetical protein
LEGGGMSVKRKWFVLLCGIVLAVPAIAQEEPAPPPPSPPAEEKPAAAEPAPAKKSSVEDPPLKSWGGMTVSIAAWNPTLVGADEEVTIFNSPSGPQPLYQTSDERIRETIRVSYHMPKDWGSIVIGFDSMKHDDTMEVATPGQFLFAETLPYPQVLGVFDDGLADGVASRGVRKTSEFRLEYQRKAFDTKWVRGWWSAGYRELSHERVLDASYFAIVPNLPPVIPPLIEPGFDPESLVPQPDMVNQLSQFTGHGLGAALDVEFPVHKRVAIISGLSIGVVRGDIRSTFESTSSAYFLGASTVPLTRDELFAIMDSIPPPPADGEPAPPLVTDINQRAFSQSLSTTSDSQTTATYDIYLGVNVICYPGLRVFLTVRDVSYGDVGRYIIPSPGPTMQTKTLSAGYEGYNVGISWRF